PLTHHWLTAKVLALLAYIGFGVAAIKRASRPAFAGAVLSFGYMLGVAKTKSVLSWLVLLYFTVTHKKAGKILAGFFVFCAWIGRRLLQRKVADFFLQALRLFVQADYCLINTGGAVTALAAEFFGVAEVAVNFVNHRGLLFNGRGNLQNAVADAL